MLYSKINNIRDSTRSEIEYAKRQGKTISYLEGEKI